MKLQNYLPLLLLAALLVFSYSGHAQIITTVAGGDSVGLGDGGPAVDCELFTPIGIVFDTAGNYYITDRDEHRVRKVSTSGIITTIAGTGALGFSGDNGPATAAELNGPYGIAIDATGNIYFSDDGNNRIRKINTAGIITTIAGNGGAVYNGDNIAATAAAFSVGGIAIDNPGNIYIADGYNYRIRKIDVSGMIYTIAGSDSGAAGYNGDEIAATTAKLNSPNYVARDNTGNIYIADAGNQRVRKIDTNGIIHTIAGTGTAGYSGDNGPATAAQLNRPLGVSVDNLGNVYIGDANNNVVRKVNGSGAITTIAGNTLDGYRGDGVPATQTSVCEPVGVAFDKEYNIYIADAANDRIRRVSSTVSVQSIKSIADNITVYPNPCSGNFTVSIVTNMDEQATITITDIAGHRIKEMQAKTNSPFTVQLDAPAGVYFIYATTASGTLTEKVIKTRSI